MNAPMTLILPPQSVESEQAVIGGLILDARAWERVADVVAEADFYRDDHRRIFRNIKALADANKPIDLLTVEQSIRENNEIDQTGGLAYLAEIANAVPSAVNIRRYAETVSDKARLRGLLAVSDDIQGIVFRAGSDTASDRIDEAAGLLMNLAENSERAEEPKSVGSILGSVIESIEERFARGGSISGLPTGFKDIDSKLDGLKGGDLIIIAGRPSMGKTTIAMNIAEKVATAGNPALVFSLEMGEKQLVTRCLSSIGGINSKALASGNMNEDEWDRVSGALAKLHTAPLIIDQSASLSASQMQARARRQKRKTGLSLIVIDYLQLMRGQGNNRNEELGEITRSLKLMARNLDVPVICLSQLSRKCEERGDKRPILSDLRESGSIEQDADVVLMMYRDDYYNPESPYVGLAEAIVRKNRMGDCGAIQMAFQGQYSRFKDADYGAIAEANKLAAERKPISRSRGFRE